MSNWKERAGVELAKIRAIAEAQRAEVEAQRAEAEVAAKQQRLTQEAQEQRRIAEDQAKIEIGKAKLGQFDVLGYSQQLADINSDILKGIGKVEISDAVVTPKKAQQVVALQFSIPDPKWVEEKTEAVYKKRWGKEDVYEDRGSYPSPDGWKTHSVWVGTRSVEIETLVGIRVVGGDCRRIDHRSLRIAYYTNLESGDTKVGVEDEHYPLMLHPDAVLNEDWKIVNASIDREEEVPFDFSPDYNGRPRYGVCVSFPYDKYDADVLNTLMDPLLLKLSTVYLSQIDEWIKNRMEVDVKIREIQQSRVGQVKPIR